jgi:hypothetical protein
MVLSHRHLQENALKKFINQFNEKISGVISCFDRMLFKGYLPLGWSGAMERLLAREGLLIKEFKQFVMKQSECIKSHAEAVAARHDRPFLYLNGRIRKEELVRKLAEQDGITQGLVCVLRAVEPCQSFKMIPGEGRPQLVNAPRKCLCFYFYFIDREFGLMHVRIQSWFPLVIQICLNGHEWLARKMDAHGIEYRKQDNAFLWIGDCERAQKFADRFEKKNWPRVLAAFAKRVNPLLGNLLAGMEYYWVMDQAEYATDVMFESSDALKDPYEQLLKHAILCFGVEDVLTFLGRKMHGRFQGEVLTDMKKKRFPGARVKHRMKENWIKMYDKHGCVLRVETVINNPREFKVRRHGKRKGEIVLDWFPMAKGVANMPRYREVALAANRRYLDALFDGRTTGRLPQAHAPSGTACPYHNPQPPRIESGPGGRRGTDGGCDARRTHNQRLHQRRYPRPPLPRIPGRTGTASSAPTHRTPAQTVALPRTDRPHPPLSPLARHR